MRMPISLWVFLIPFFSIFFSIIITPVVGKCLNDEKLLLLHFRASLKYNSSLSTKLVHWNGSEDCCNWGGIECNSDGQIIGLDISSESIAGRIDDSSSLFSLQYLKNLNLANNDLIGELPGSLGKLTHLTDLILHENKFTGSIPSLRLCKNLSLLALDQNNLTGEFPPSYWEGLDKLAFLTLHNNSFSGAIPESLFSLPSIQLIDLSENRFSGQIGEIKNVASHQLYSLDMGGNKFEGPIPEFLFKLRGLESILVSGNNFIGSLELSKFQIFKKLRTLDLSRNKLSINICSSGSPCSRFPQLDTLQLASCNIQELPDLKNQSRLMDLDLSDNRINGHIPNWIWEVGSGVLKSINLSHNNFSGLQEPYSFPTSLYKLDLHANQLSGKIPPVPQEAYYVDYSDNHFNSSLPIDIGHNLTSTNFFSVSKNKITGTIPDSICRAINLQVLDLSHNNLSSRIPSCLMEMTEGLRVLNLANNHLSGSIPEISPRECTLLTLDLQRNILEGEVPESLVRCSMLEVLNLGKNLINDTFPCFLKKCTNLRVLSLRSNKLYGDTQCIGETGIWPKLQIIDLASNYFTGHVTKNFLNWRSMITGADGGLLKGGHLQIEVIYGLYYVDTVTIVIKGVEMLLVKILAIFTSIDFSNNRFSGEIPSSIGELKALYVLNMSHNTFTGSIPTSFGNLRQLGSLDLSVNNLAGKIPTELTYLTFLSFLNLSHNQLEGRIPSSSQFLTFTETSFGGNNELCGFQLNISCNSNEPPPPSEEADEQSESIVDLVSVELGFVVGLAIFVVPLLFSNRWSRLYYKHVEQIVVSKVCRYFERRNLERRNPLRRQE